MNVTERMRTRFLPALVFATGLTFVAAGLLSFIEPPTVAEAAPTPSDPVIEVPQGSPDLLTFPPLASPSIGPSPSGGPIEPAVATRIVIPAMRIDLAIVPGPSGYPYCNVAMYLRELKQPGEPGATFIFAHARTGMFLPLLEESKRNNGRKMVGMLVEVYTADDQVHLYEISQVRRHQTTLDRPLRATTEQLWLQTSEGVKGTKEKLHLVATPVSVVPADPADAHPKPKIVRCS